MKQRYDKKFISNLLKLGNDIIRQYIKQHNNVSELQFLLKNIGKLPSNYDGNWLIDLVGNPNEGVRLLAVKNIGKLKSEQYLTLLYNIVSTDASTRVKTEAVSAIGRIKTEKCIPYLINILYHKDPKIVCQAIRGLLFFKNIHEVHRALFDLKNNENEIIRDVINKELYKKKNEFKSHTHSDVLPYLSNVVVNGDVIEVLKLIPEDSIHLTFTSPPYYNARDYSIYPSYDAYLLFLEEVFKEVYRTTKEGRFLIVNTSPVIVPRISRAHSSKRYPIPFDIHYYLIKMGWEFIDDIVWLKPEYTVKNRVGGFHQHRKPLGYKPNSVTEYLLVYRKKTDKLLDWNMRQYSNEIVDRSKVEDNYETSNVWHIKPKSDKVHSAIFPEALCERVVKYYSFYGDLVFDPFGGSGTLGRVSRKLGRKSFLTEMEPKYFEYMKTLEDDNLLEFEKKTSFFSIDEFKKIIK